MFKVMVMSRSKGQNNSAVHRSNGRLISPEIMKQLPFIASALWPERNTVEGYIFKADGQNNLTVYKFHAILIWPENMKEAIMYCF